MIWGEFRHKHETVITIASSLIVCKLEQILFNEQKKTYDRYAIICMFIQKWNVVKEIVTTSKWYYVPSKYTKIILMNVNSLLRKSQFNFHSKATGNTDVHILGLGRQIKMKYTTWNQQGSKIPEPRRPAIGRFERQCYGNVGVG